MCIAYLQMCDSSLDVADSCPDAAHLQQNINVCTYVEIIYSLSKLVT